MDHKRCTVQPFCHTTGKASRVTAATFGQYENGGSVCCSPPEFQTSPRVSHKDGIAAWEADRSVFGSVPWVKDRRWVVSLLLLQGGELSVPCCPWLLGPAVWLCWDLEFRFWFYRLSVKEHKAELPFFWEAFSCLFQTLNKCKQVEK